MGVVLIFLVIAFGLSFYIILGHEVILLQSSMNSKCIIDVALFYFCIVIFNIYFFWDKIAIIDTYSTLQFTYFRKHLVQDSIPFWKLLIWWLENWITMTCSLRQFSKNEHVIPSIFLPSWCSCYVRQYYPLLPSI